jgi:hypothetical protein
MREDALDHRRLFDRSDDLQLAATPATLNIKVEYTLQQPRPTHARRLENTAARPGATFMAASALPVNAEQFLLLDFSGNQDSRDWR